MVDYSDTMLLLRNTEGQDLPKGLGDLGRTYFDLDMWKETVDLKAQVEDLAAEDTGLEVKDTELEEAPELIGPGLQRLKTVAAHQNRDLDYYEYNSADVQVCATAVPILIDRILELDTSSAAKLDHKLAPIFREMNNRPFCIDERIRGKRLGQFLSLQERLLGDFQKVAGVKVNPKAPAQVGEWLYSGLGLTPPYNSAGEEFEDGDKWSSGIHSLLELIKRGLPKEIYDAVKSLIRYKACATQISRYLYSGRLNKRIIWGEDSDLDANGRADPVVHNKTELLPDRPAISQIYVNWLLHSAATGRCSTTPNMQTHPTRAFAVEQDAEGRWKATNMRELIIAPPGHVFVGADLAQIELRVYAAASGDSLLIDAYTGRVLDSRGKKFDVHSLNYASVAAPDKAQLMEYYDWIQYRLEQGYATPQSKGPDMDQVKAADDLRAKGVRIGSPAWRLPPPDAYEAKRLGKEAKKFLRTVAKKGGFGVIYGAYRDKLYDIFQYEVDKSTFELVFEKYTPEQAAAFFDGWHGAHKWTKQWQQKCKRHVTTHGWIAARFREWTRKRFFLYGADEENQIANMIVQGSSALVASQMILECVDAIPFGLWTKWTGMQHFVHDQLIFTVPESKGEKCLKKVQRIMTTEYEGIPVECDAALSKDWAKQ